MKNKLLQTLIALSLLVFPFLNTVPVEALNSNAESGFKKGLQKSGDTTNQRKACADANGNWDSTTSQCTDSHGKQIDTTSVTSTIQSTINLLLFVAGAIAVLVIVIGAMRYTLSSGDLSAANRGRDSIIYAIVGLVMAILAYAIINFVLDNI